MKLGTGAPLSALVLGALLALPACHRRGGDANGAPSATTSAAPSRAAKPSASVAGASSAAASSSPSATANPSTPPTALTSGCRVLGVKGNKPGAAPAPRSGTRLTGLGWFELENGVELAVKHGDTLREFRLVGPGVFQACPRADETVLVASGTVTTTPGPGSRAGAAVTLATPLGVVEYPDAELRLEVTASKLSLTVKQGQATLVSAAQAGTTAMPLTVRGPSGHTELRGGANVPELVRRCEDLQQHAGAPLAPPSDAKERARWAVTRMQTRRSARVACDLARAATGRLSEPERGRFDAQLEGRAASVHGVTPPADSSGVRP